MTVFNEYTINRFNQSQKEWFEKTGIRLNDDEFLIFLISGRTIKVKNNEE